MPDGRVQNVWNACGIYLSAIEAPRMYLYVQICTLSLIVHMDGHPLYHPVVITHLSPSHRSHHTEDEIRLFTRQRLRKVTQRYRSSEQQDTI